MRTNDSWVWVLLAAVIVSALFVVNVRHLHRVAYHQYHTQAKQLDALNDEWGQLLIEQNLWSSAPRIEKHASEQLNMRQPKPEEVHVVDKGLLVDQLAGATNGTR